MDAGTWVWSCETTLSGSTSRRNFVWAGYLPAPALPLRAAFIAWVSSRALARRSTICGVTAAAPSAKLIPRSAVFDRACSSCGACVTAAATPSCCTNMALLSSEWNLTPLGG